MGCCKSSGAHAAAPAEQCKDGERASAATPPTGSEPSVPSGNADAQPAHEQAGARSSNHVPSAAPAPQGEPETSSTQPRAQSTVAAADSSTLQRSPPNPPSAGSAGLPVASVEVQRFAVCRAFGIWAEGAAETFTPASAPGEYRAPSGADPATVHKVFCRIFRINLPGLEAAGAGETEASPQTTAAVGGSHASRLIAESTSPPPVRSKSPTPARTDALPRLAQDLATEASGALLRGDHLDRLLHERLALFDGTKGADAFAYLAECFGRADDYSKASATQQLLDYPHVLDLLVDFAFLLRDRESATALNFPSIDLGMQVEGLLSGRSTCPAAFIAKFCARVEGEDVGTSLDGCLAPMLNNIFAQMEGRHMGELKSEPSQSLVRMACGQGGKPMTRALVRSPLFLPGDRERSLERDSLVGRLMTISPLDFHLGQRSVRAQRCSPPGGLLKEPLPALTRRLEELRLPVNNMHGEAKALFLASFKASKFARGRAQAWLARVADQGEPRAASVADTSLLERFGGGSLQEFFGSSSHAGSSEALGLNVVWVIASLCDKISLEDPGIDLFYRLRHANCSQVGCLLGPYAFASSASSANLTPELIEKRLRELGDVGGAAALGADAGGLVPNFKTEIFWLGCRAFSTLLRPTLLQVKAALERFSQIQERLEAAGASVGPLRGVFDAMMSQELGTALCFEVILMSPQFQLAFAHFMALAMTLVVKAAADGPEVLAFFPAMLLLHLAEVAAFTSLYAKSSICNRAKSIAQKNVKPPGFLAGTGSLQPGLVCDFALVCVDPSRDLNMRIAGITLLHLLIEDTGIEAVRKSASSSETLLGSLAEVFVDVGSEDRQTQLRQRIPVLKLLDALLRDRVCADRLKSSVPKLGPKFGAFISLLLKDMMSFLEDGLDKLAQLRARLQPKSDTNGDISVDEASLEQETQFAKASLELGQMALSVLRWISFVIGGNVVLASSEVVPSQLVVALNCMADRLAGRHALQLKVANMAAYGFDPRKLLGDVVRIYLTMAEGQTGKDFAGKVAAEERYFNPTVFQKILRIARRERDGSIASAQELGDFAAFIDLVCKQREAVSAEAEIYKDAPEEFLDGMLYELMQEPVKLPASGVVMDKMHITRHLLVTPEDPFTRVPLKPEDLVPLPELQAKIEAWKLERQSAARATPTEGRREAAAEVGSGSQLDQISAMLDETGQLLTNSTTNRV